MTAHQFRRCDRTVTAMRWTGLNNTEMAAWCPNFGFKIVAGAPCADLHAAWDAIEPGDWVVHDGGRYWPYKAEQFVETFEPADADAAHPLRTVVTVHNPPPESSGESVKLALKRLIDEGGL